MAQQARALLSSFRMSERGVNYGVVAALRVLDALDEASPSVGGPMDICRITLQEAHHLDPQEIDEVREHVGRWLTLEKQAVDELFG